MDVDDMDGVSKVDDVDGDWAMDLVGDTRGVPVVNVRGFK
jgi:hypothetical protein